MAQQPKLVGKTRTGSKGKHAGAKHYEREQARKGLHKKWLAEKRFGVYVYEDADTGIVKGMMGIGMSGDDDKKGAFELHYLYVDPDDARKGVGSEMLRFFERKGEEKGCMGFVVWVLEENEMGRKFYEKNSYRSDGKEKIFRRWNKREIRYVKD